MTKNLTFIDTIDGDEYVAVTVDTGDNSVSIEGSVPDETVAEFDDWDALCEAWPGVWSGLVQRFAEDCDDDEYPAMDIRRERERAERRASKAEPSAFDGPMERARDLLRKATIGADAKSALPEHLREDADLTPDALANSLTYVIEIVTHDGTAELGGSKLGGPAHVPSDFEWPTIDGEPAFLLAQINLAELAAADVSKSVPAKGVLYVFVTEEGAATVRYADSASLSVRKAGASPEYVKELEEEEPVSFRPAFYFAQGSDTGMPAAIAAALPETLRAEVAEILGTSAEPCDAFAGNRIFGGDPVDWQAMGESDLKHELFMQLDFGDGNVSVGVHPVDLAQAEFEDADCAYCGT